MARTDYTRQSYSGTTPTTATIVGVIGVGDTTATLSSATGFPSTTSGGFTATLGLGTATEEQIFVGTRTGTALSNITRGFNGTTDQTQPSGISIKHTSGKHDYDEANLAVVKTIGQATAVGQILVADAANSFAAVQAKTSGQILVGNGTTVASVAVSGDATLSSAGALVIGASKITNTMMADNAIDSAELVAGSVDLTHLSLDFTTAGKALLDDADAAAQRTTLGLGTMATQAAGAVTITGGSVTGITDVAVADGGTGASTSAGAAANLGFPLGTVTGGYATATTAQSGITTITDLTSLTVTFTALAGRRYRITGYVRVSKDGTGAAVECFITDGSNTQIQDAIATPAAGGYWTLQPVAIAVPGAGSITYKLRMQSVSGAVTASAAATAPNFILVEDIGT